MSLLDDYIREQVEALLVLNRQKYWDLKVIAHSGKGFQYRVAYTVPRYKADGSFGKHTWTYFTDFRSDPATVLIEAARNITSYMAGEWGRP